MVLLVGGDLATAQACARAASPLPVVRAKHLAIATDRVRSMRPVAVVVAPDVTDADAAQLHRVGAEHAARVVRLIPSDTDVTLRAALSG